MHKVFRSAELGLEVEIGKFARQADGATWIKAGKNIILSTVVASKEAKEFAGFFPLTIEYRERASAAGRIPGGYVKREGKLSDIEVLTSRLIDRPIRPLFPDYYFNEVQLLSTVYSADGSFPLDILAMIGSSLALTISNIPFFGPIGGVSVGKVDGQWKFNLTHEESTKSDASIVIAGTIGGISMVEGCCNNIPEAELIDLLFKAHEIIKKQIEWQLSIQKELNVAKASEISNPLIDWVAWEQKVKDFFAGNFVDGIFADDKALRSKAMDKLEKDLLEHCSEDIKSGAITTPIIKYLFQSLLKVALPNAMAQKKLRIDGRKFDQIRPIAADVALLPSVHGSALFQRGETQALASVTLGTGQDAQRVETLLAGMQERLFMLHYNFPPFSTGEVKPMRGTGRREIGHGYLAETSFENVLPSQEDFPYTIRSVVDILESNGSSSMATVCATTLALMDGGVPIKNMVSGIAMGLIQDSSNNFHVLSDILGTEDALGLMDFKVTGTDTGIMAFQLDIKDPSGLSKELLSNALEQARVGRLHILNEMRKVMTEPRKNLSELAPRVTMLKVPQDKIGIIIGPGGKTIKEIIAQTNTQIDIEDDGTVKIFSKNTPSAVEAESWIKILIGDIEVGAFFEGTIRRYAEFGIFVEIVAGKDGLVHISSINKNKQRDIEDKHPLNSKLRVQVAAYDHETGRVRLIAPELE